MNYVSVQNDGATWPARRYSAWKSLGEDSYLAAVNRYSCRCLDSNLQRYRVAWRRFASESAYRARAGPGQAYPD
jgi:hypothetical protein